MKKLFALILTMAMIFSLGAGALAEDVNSLEYVLEKGTLIMGLDVGFAPMGFYNEDGVIIGYDVDLAYEVCDRLGVELVLQPIAWAAKELELNDMNIDCIWNGLSITPDRLASMTITPPYLYNALVFVAIDKSIVVKEDLAGKSVAVQSGSFALDVLNGDADVGEDLAGFTASLSEVLSYDDYMMALMDLKNGNVDAVLVDIVVADFYLAEMDEEDVCFYLEQHLADDYFGIGFRKADVKLCDAVFGALQEMAADGVLAEITTHWFGDNVSLIEAAQ